MEDHFPTDYTSVSAFHKALPTLHSSEHAIRWELRFRAENGLLDEGVVIERRSDPNATRPSILISPSRYLARLKRMSRGVAA